MRRRAVQLELLDAKPFRTAAERRQYIRDTIDRVRDRRQLKKKAKATTQ